MQNLRKTNDELYPALISGDEHAREEMIRANSEMAPEKVDSFLRTFPKAEYLRDDLEGEARVAIVRTINKLQTNIRENLTGYIYKAIDNALKDFIDREIYQMPPSTVRDRKSKGYEVEAPTFEDVDFCGRPAGSTAGENQIRVIELWDEILGCCETEEESQVIQLRADGHTDPEISKMLSISKSRVWRSRRDVYDRFLERSEEARS